MKVLLKEVGKDFERKKINGVIDFLTANFSVFEFARNGKDRFVAGAYIDEDPDNFNLKLHITVPTSDITEKNIYNTIFFYKTRKHITARAKKLKDEDIDFIKSLCSDIH